MAADEGGVCPDAGRAMRSSPMRRKAQRFGRRHSWPPIEFPCSPPQRDGKSHKTTGNPANVGLNQWSRKSKVLGCSIILMMRCHFSVVPISENLQKHIGRES